MKVVVFQGPNLNMLRVVQGRNHIYGTNETWREIPPGDARNFAGTKMGLED